MLKKNHTFDWHNKKILNFETNYYKKLILEMVHIKSQKKMEFILSVISNCWLHCILIYFRKFLTTNNNVKKTNIDV